MIEPEEIQEIWNRLRKAKSSNGYIDQMLAIDMVLLLKEIERLKNGIQTFVDKNYKGSSKADREDYGCMVTAKDIYDLRELIVK